MKLFLLVSFLITYLLQSTFACDALQDTLCADGIGLCIRIFGHDPKQLRQCMQIVACPSCHRWGCMCVANDQDDQVPQLAV